MEVALFIILIGEHKSLYVLNIGVSVKGRYIYILNIGVGKGKLYTLNIGVSVKGHYVSEYWCIGKWGIICTEYWCIGKGVLYTNISVSVKIHYIEYWCIGKGSL